MTEIKPHISIIVPVYNVEKFLVRCLDSIFNQHFSGIYEVIAVEDASTDNSLQLLKSYQAKEVRLTIIEHGINKKLSTARTTGMLASSGEYIMHVDSDDWLLPNTLENLYNKCKETDADVIVFNYQKEDNEGKITFIEGIKKELITTDKQKVQEYFLGACWNKIVKRSLIANMIYGTIGINSEEDLLYSTEILLRANTIYLLPEYYYTYFVNRASITSAIRPELFLQTQVIVLSQIQIVISKYKADSQVVNILLNYFEKFIYLEFAKILFWSRGQLFDHNQFIRELCQFPVMTQSRIAKLELSMKNKFNNIVEVTRRFGLKTSLWIIFRSFKR